MPFLPISRTIYNEENEYPPLCGVIPKWIVIWLFPMFVAGVSFLFQNTLLHYTTYIYVHEMTQIDLERKPVDTPGYGQPIPLSIGVAKDAVSFGSADDPVSEMLGYENVQIHFLDFLALLIPATFFVMSLILDNYFTFSRAWFCCSFMLVLKGIVDAVTVVPDSSGWQVCQARLATSTKGYTVEWYAQEHSFWDIIVSELYAPTGRFCSDMMVSGHTQMVTVFGLGLFESVTLVTAYRGVERQWRLLAQTFVAVAVVLQQICEIFFVLKSRFHYSSDILMAVVVAYFAYTSAPMAGLARSWILQGRDPATVKAHFRKSWQNIKKHMSEPGSTAKYLNNDDDTQAYFDSDWFAVLNPGVIQLGCCCSPNAQLYFLNGVEMSHVIDELQEQINSGHKMTEMTEQVKRGLLKSLLLPQECEKPKQENMHPLLP